MGERSMCRCCEFYVKLEELLEEHNVGGLTDTSPKILVALIRNAIWNWNLGIAMREKEHKRREQL